MTELIRALHKEFNRKEESIKSSLSFNPNSLTSKVSRFVNNINNNINANNGNGNNNVTNSSNNTTL